MKFSHSEETREDRHVDVLTDEENGLRIIVSRLGAELISLARINEAGEWTGLGTRATPFDGLASVFLGIFVLTIRPDLVRPFRTTVRITR